MPDTRGFLPDGTHAETGVARDPQGYDAQGQHISQSKQTRGLRGEQPRREDGKFGEKTGAAPEVTLDERSDVVEPYVGILGETPSQYARRSQRFEQLLRRDLNIDEDTTTEQALRYSDLDARSIIALMHAAVENEHHADTVAAWPEVDALYAQAQSAERRLLDTEIRALLNEHRPGTKSILLGTWSGVTDVDLVAFENEDGTLDTDYDSINAATAFHSKNYQRFTRLIESGAYARVTDEEQATFRDRVEGEQKLVGQAFYRIGVQS
jgi:hypothetical protein